MEIKVKNPHLESKAPGGQTPSGSGSPDNPKHKPPASTHPSAKWLDGPEPPGGGRRGLPRKQVSPA